MGTFHAIYFGEENGDHNFAVLLNCQPDYPAAQLVRYGVARDLLGGFAMKRWVSGPVVSEPHQTRELCAIEFASQARYQKFPVFLQLEHEATSRIRLVMISE